VNEKKLSWKLINWWLNGVVTISDQLARDEAVYPVVPATIINLMVITR